jgi:hypothetical protein
MGLVSAGALPRDVQANSPRLRFPSSQEDYEHYYPTAYMDQAGLDWNCGDLQYGGHIGSDFGGGSWDGMAEGRDVNAAADGVVSYVEDGGYDMCAGDCPDGGFGNVVYLRHLDGRQTVYAHLSNGSIPVVEGQRVRCGDFLGLMGSSGNSTGPHLHFGLRSIDGAWVEPFEGPCSMESSAWVDQGEYGALPALECDDAPPPCMPLSTLSCGDGITANNTDPGSTDERVFYGCDHDLLSSGNELSWEVATDLDEAVTLDLTGLSADLDLYLLDSSACDTQDCVQVSRLGSNSDESITFEAQAEHRYTVVVDGFEDAASDFTLTVSCEGQLPSDPTGETTGEESGGESTSNPADSGEASEASSDEGESSTSSGTFGDDDGSGLEEETSGCSCRSPGPTGRTAGWLILGLLLWPLRRTRAA